MGCGEGGKGGQGNKGGGCNCCCDRCDHLTVKCHECCYCVCRSICVTLDVEPGGSASQCGCDDVEEKFDWDCDTNSYHGSIPCGTIAVDFDISFRKLEDGNCYICLDSSCFRSEDGGSVSTQEQCILLAEPADTECTKLAGSGEGSAGGSWTFDLNECIEQSCAQNMDVTLSIRCVNYISPAGFGCDPDCEDCECACECLCINYHDVRCLGDGDEPAVTVKEACWDDVNKEWTAFFDCETTAGDTQEITITIEENSDGVCSLVLSATEGSVLDPRQVLNCPEVSASWEIDFGIDGIAIISIECAWCGCDSEREQVDFLCCGRFLPNTLHAEFTNVLNCECYELSGVTLVRTPGLLEWNGEIESCLEAQVDPEDPSLGPGPMTVTLECIGENDCTDMTITIGGCSADSGSPEVDCVCDPLFLEFKNLSIDACCTLAILGLNNTIDITVTE